MPGSPSALIFPFTEKIVEGLNPSPEQFEWIYQGKGALARLEHGYCIARGLADGIPRILFFFQRKPYSAGKVGGGGLEETTLREFFLAIHKCPSCRLDFFTADPILLKSLLVLTQKVPRTGGSVEVIKLTGLVIDLMETHKDALMAVIQGGRYGLVFAKAGKIVKAYFSQRLMMSQAGMEWADLFEQIEMELVKGQQVIIQVFEDLHTRAAADYLEGTVRYSGGVFRYYTRPLPELIVRFKGRTSNHIQVRKFPFVIGRAEDADLTLDDPGVSRRHAAIEEEGGRVMLRDIGSLNGVFVNDQRLPLVQLADGDRVAIGGHLIQVIFPRPEGADAPLVTPGARQDATIALGREAKVAVECPVCGARGKVDAASIYRQATPRIRCPRCRHAFEPGGKS
jgi:predicted Zn finger-like uncharacterized protein